jgi:hypothetical protein
LGVSLLNKREVQKHDDFIHNVSTISTQLIDIKATNVQTQNSKGKEEI